MGKVLPIVLLATGGAAGTLARVGLSTVIMKWHGGAWPIGTLVVNAIGCLLIGLLWGWLDPKTPGGSLAMLALVAGFCGAFTTFSTFALDSHGLAREAGLHHMMLNLVLHNIIGVTLVVVGLWAGSRLAAS